MSMKSLQKLKWHLGFKAHYSHIRVTVKETDLHQFMNFMLLTATYQGNFKLINCHHPVMDIILLSCTFVNHNERPKGSSTKKLLSTQKQQRKERLCLVKIAVGTCSYIVYIFRHLLIIPPPPPPKVLFFIDSYHQYLKYAMHCKVVRA